jgi:hypothetical protein
VIAHIVLTLVGAASERWSVAAGRIVYRDLGADKTFDAQHAVSNRAPRVVAIA